MKVRKVVSGATAVALALAGVLLTGGMASADEVTPLGQPDFICTESGDGWQPKVDTSGDPATVTVTAPEGFLIDKYCVKAGTTKFIIDVTPPSATAVIDHPEKDSVSHYQVHFIPAPVVVEADAKFDVGIIPATCDDGAILEYGEGNISNATFDKWSTPSGTEGPAHYEVTAKPILGHTWVEGVTGIISGELAGPIGYQSEDPQAPCYTEPGGEEFPVPALFNAEPTPASCASAGVFNDAGLGGALIDTSPDGTTKVYSFADDAFRLVVARTTAGQVDLWLVPQGDTVITGLNPAKWTDNGDGTFSRIVVLPAQLSADDPACLAAPTPTTLANPVVVDVCGAENDEVTLPEDTEAVVYTFNSDDVTNFDVRATVQEGFVVETVPAGWTGSEGVYVYAVDLTNTVCAGGTTPPTTTPASNPTTGGLAATGGGEVSPLMPLAGGLTVALGIVLMLMRRFARR
jgi:hypothetical protein